MENYLKTEHGIIAQIVRKPKIYNSNYFDYYLKIKEQTIQISYLRLGFILGALKKAPCNILDIGYGIGSFLSTAKKIIPQCYGYDITTLNVPEGCTRVENIFKDKYELVCFFDSLEHMENINVIKNIKCDYMCISTPWCTYISDDWFKTWKHHKPDEHLWYFDDISLKKFMDSIGFDCIAINNLEDTIRVDKNSPNILTGIFKRK